MATAGTAAANQELVADELTAAVSEDGPGQQKLKSMRVHPFHDGETFATFRDITEKATREIEALENDYVLKASPAELERHYVSQVTVTPLALDAKNHYIDSQKGTQLDVSHDFRRGGFGRKPLVVKGTSIDIAIPFTGDPGTVANTAFLLQSVWVPGT